MNMRKKKEKYTECVRCVCVLIEYLNAEKKIDVVAEE